MNEKDADLWNSGKVEEVNTVIAEYDGQPLASNTQAWWKVRVWNQDGEPSKWSEPASFGVGLLDGSEGTVLASGKHTLSCRLEV